MRMTIEGIGKVSSATVPLDGITVVAGENNTGKSTIGKALFAMADGCYDLEQRMIERIRRHIVFAVNSQLPLTGDESLGSRRKTTARVASLVEDYLNHGDGDADGLMQTLRDNDIPLPKPDRVSSIAEQEMSRTLPEFAASQIRSRLNELFHEDPVPRISGHGRTCSLTLTEDQPLADYQMDGGRISFSGESMGSMNTVLIDDPHLIDDIQDDDPKRWGVAFRSRWNNSSVLNAITGEALRFADDDMEPDSAAAVIVQDIRDIIHLRLEGDDRNGNILDDTLCLDPDVRLREANTSMGAKSFLTVSQLLCHGVIHRDTILILDEPEIHLHPQWQIDYARLLARLVHDLDVRLVVTTHSPYFLDALHVYARAYGMAERYQVMLPQPGDNGAVEFHESSESEQAAYLARMAEPFRQLAQIKDQMAAGLDVL